MSGAATASCRPVARGQVGQFRSAADCAAVCAGGAGAEPRYVCAEVAPYYRESMNDEEYGAGAADPGALRCFACDAASGACRYAPTDPAAVFATPELCAAGCAKPEEPRYVCDETVGGPRAATTPEERAAGAVSPDLLSCYDCGAAGACEFRPKGDGSFKTAGCGGGCFYRCAPTESADGAQRVERTTEATGFLAPTDPRCYGCVGSECAYIPSGTGTTTNRAGCGACGAPPPPVTYVCTERVDQNGSQVLDTRSDGSGVTDSSQLKCWFLDAATGEVSYRAAGDGNQKTNLKPDAGQKYYFCDPVSRAVKESPAATPFTSPDDPACFACRGAACDFVPEGTGTFKNANCDGTCVPDKVYYACTPDVDASGVQVPRVSSTPTAFTDPMQLFCYDCDASSGACVYREDGRGKYRSRDCGGACAKPASESFLDKIKKLPFWVWIIVGVVVLIVLVLIFRGRKTPEKESTAAAAPRES